MRTTTRDTVPTLSRRRRMADVLVSNRDSRSKSISHTVSAAGSLCSPRARDVRGGWSRSPQRTAAPTSNNRRKNDAKQAGAGVSASARVPHVTSLRQRTRRHRRPGLDTIAAAHVSPSERSESRDLHCERGRFTWRPNGANPNATDETETAGSLRAGGPTAAPQSKEDPFGSWIQRRGWPSAPPSARSGADPAPSVRSSCRICVPVVQHCRRSQSVYGKNS